MTDPYTMNTISLAFLGDSVYELFVRSRLMNGPEALSGHADRLHRAAVSYVRADAQAAVIKALLPELPEEHRQLVTRARNHRTATKPKNADAVTYKWATAFEAYLGYLYLSGQQELLQTVMERAAAITEEKDHE